MAVDILSVWQEELLALPKVGDSSWAVNFAKWTSDRVTPAAADGKGLFPDPSALTPTGFIFNYNQPLFVSLLEVLTPVPTAEEGITNFADAWEQTLIGSTIIVAPGTYTTAPTPATTFSAVASTIIDPPSIALGKLKLLELIADSSPNDNPSVFPEKFREAFLLLTITVTGTNSASPTAPLVAPAVPLV